MHHDKSPGPDGMNPKFFHKYWHIVGNDVVSSVKDFFRTELMPAVQNTNIVLIPKKKKPDMMSELRPISLCNVVAKIITKVLTNRMKGLLSEVISVNQIAFIPGRLITDNIMVSFEILHYLKRKQVGKDGYMALKLDMSKAYDRVDWNFLCVMLSRLGFAEKWVRLIYGCLSTVQYNVVSSGYTLGPIVPSRGLRQGDPISPYLFLVCAEGLSALMRRYEERKWIHGCKVANGASVVSHMLFADDSFLYCKATHEEVSHIIHLLDSFAKASGQRVNFYKSTVFYSSNTTPIVRNSICQRLGIHEVDDRSKYLGLPSTIGRNRKAIFSYLSDKVQKRIQSWDNKFLSRAGKEVLIKSVVQALPAYTMNVFLIPVGICQDIERSINKFWWRSNTNKGIYWMSWDRLSHHKSTGGMGFRDFRDCNIALLAKQGWRLLTCDNSLVGKIFKARYFANGSFLTATLGNNPSYIWRSVLEAQGLVRDGVRRLVGNGSTVSILKDPWLLDEVNPFIESQQLCLVDKMVDSLMKDDVREWDEEVLRDVLTVRDQELVWKIPLSSDVERDGWFWNKEASGLFTVRSAYRILQQQKLNNHQPVFSGAWTKLWQLKLPPKVKDFLWRVCTNSFPTRFQLTTKHIPINSDYPMCLAAPETSLHVLVRCPFAQNYWQQSQIPAVGLAAMLFCSWWEEGLQVWNEAECLEAGMVLWSIWKVRNEVVWNEKQPTSEEVLFLAKLNFVDWYNAQNQELGSPNEPNRVSLEHWTPPTFPKYKVNVDGALFPNEKSYGIGLVARDSFGLVIQAKTLKKAGDLQPHEVEAIGIKEALSWIKDNNWPSVIVESDCRRVVLDLQGNKDMTSPYGHIMLASVTNVSFNFVKRSANKVAHSLARSSLFEANRVFSGVEYLL
uniref:Reverse transcriptase domain-containing protein n=1 Tax=Cannabis sativa TaxID=3483 RepID=A0A803QS69_CANSA